MAYKTIVEHMILSHRVTFGPKPQHLDSLSCNEAYVVHANKVISALNLFQETDLAIIKLYRKTRYLIGPSHRQARAWNPIKA